MGGAGSRRLEILIYTNASNCSSEDWIGKIECSVQVMNRAFLLFLPEFDPKHDPCFSF
jgi:hypothetical protein